MTLDLNHAVRWPPGACVLFVAVAFASAPPPTKAAESAAHLAVWQVGNKKGTYTGTAFAVGERHFLTNAHVIEGFVDADSKHIVLTQRGNAAELTVNYGHVALSLTYDLALFTTREEVEHVLKLVNRSTAVHGSGHRVIGYPGGRFAVARQAEGAVDEDPLSFIIPMDRSIDGGFSGSPVLDRHNQVVGVFHSSTGNIADAVKIEHVHDFLDGNVQWTVCRDYSTPKGCLEAAMCETQSAADAGDVLAQVELGDRYRKRKDWDRAMRWYRRAAAQGNPFAMYRLAFFHYHGKGVPRNERRAFKLMQQSAREGEPGARYNLGVFYLWGVGTPVERALGLRWLERAAAGGHHGARTLLGEMESQQPSSTDTATQGGKVMWAAKRSNVREGPGTRYAKVGFLEVGETVRVVERAGNWFRLEPRPGQPDRFVYAPLLSENARFKTPQ